MNKKIHLTIIIFLSLIIVSSTILLINYSEIYRSDYLLDKKVPGIVKGTARMVDTEAYFTKYELQESSLKLDLVCNNSNNLRISVGYKNPTEALVIAENPIKELLIWSDEDIYPKFSFDYKLQEESLTSDLKRITKEWNLLDLGFNSGEYVKADERIWFLRIKDISGGPYGYEKNITVEVNGSLYSIPEFISNIHHIEEFKLVFNKLIFETMLYPFFDGSREIVVPIRGVNHELAKEDEKTALEINGLNANSWSTTTPGTGSSSLWAIVFGTANYVARTMDDMLYPPMEARSFILGCAKSSAPDMYKVGIMDYGWRVAYCMDGDEDQTDIPTCDQTDDDFLEDMFAFADDQLGLTGKLIVFTVGHGWSVGGNHITICGNSRIVFAFWINVVRLSEYEDMIDDIITDGTHVLLWIGASFGDGLDEFSSGDHNNKLESWSYQPRLIGNPSFGVTTDYTYETFVWSYSRPDLIVLPQSGPAFLFFDASQGTCEVTVTETGEVYQDYYNDEYESENTEMYIQSTWPTYYYFYINWGY